MIINLVNEMDDEVEKTRQYYNVIRSYNWSRNEFNPIGTILYYN